MADTQQTPSRQLSGSLLLTRQIELAQRHLDQYTQMRTAHPREPLWSLAEIMARRDLDNMIHIKQLYLEVTKLERRCEELSRSHRG